MEHLSVLFDLATACQDCRDVEGLTRAFAARLARQVPSRAVLVWLLSADRKELFCRGRWFETGVRFEPLTIRVDGGLLAEMCAATRARRLAGEELDPELLTHLAEVDRERVTAALYAPLPSRKGVAGVVEMLNAPSGKFSAEEAALVEEACRIVGRSLDMLETIEDERRENLATIERLAALYDISRVFNSTLELDALLPIVTDRIRNVLGAEACNLWLVDAEEKQLYLGHQGGEDPTTDEEARVTIGEGPLGPVAQGSEARRVENAAEDEELAARRSADASFQLTSWMAAPLLKNEQVIGVLEIVNKADGGAFQEEDLFFLRSLAEQAAIALNNANLLEAERKMHGLGALLAISKEITSTLDLDHVLTTVVHQAATVVPFDRCVIALYDRNRLVIGAVSGETEVPKTREMDELRAVLEWVATQPTAVSADQYDEGWVVKPEDGQARLAPYLEKQEMSGFYALPLRDDQGMVGVLALLSGDAEFLNAQHLELLSVLASQTTVAIRNARLYQEVPLMSVWQPLVEKKQKLMSLGYGRWLEIVWKVAVVVLVLVLVPWKLRVGANATVVPAERRVVSAEVSGIVQRVWVREGQKVDAGTTLAELDDSDARVKLSAAMANLELARRQLGEAESQRDLAAANQARLRAEMCEAEARLYRERVEKARVRAPITGVVVTPKVEESAGKKLEAGDAFCELVDQERMAVEMLVPETDVDLVRPDTAVTVKLNAFPTVSFEGSVAQMGARTVEAEHEQFFVVRAVFPNPGERVRTGMVGRAKVTAQGGWWESGWYPIGYVLLRDPARWAWRKAWTWMP
jgi:RND family efflux transporter MFP subunit